MNVRRIGSLNVIEGTGKSTLFFLNKKLALFLALKLFRGSWFDFNMRQVHGSWSCQHSICTARKPRFLVVTSLRTGRSGWWIWGKIGWPEMESIKLVMSKWTDFGKLVFLF